MKVKRSQRLGVGDAVELLLLSVGAPAELGNDEGHDGGKNRGGATEAGGVEVDIVAGGHVRGSGITGTSVRPLMSMMRIMPRAAGS